MDAYLLDWLNLLLRWAHVVVAIAWIGSSFYFVFLDSSLTRPDDPQLISKGVDGELWAVHGGGFYHPQKYLVAPKQLPAHLHWFYWESYSTWLTGFGLFTLLYLFQADVYLIDKTVKAWSTPAAVTTALAFLVVFWVVYDQICRRLGEREGRIGADGIVGLCVAMVVVVASLLACHWFAGRAAFLLVGAMLATTMSANVFFWIIPGQKKVIAQMREGQPPDPIHGQRGKQRSVHNTYFTLPVLVAMLSTHYGWLVTGPWNWVVLTALMLAGALIRHSFVARHPAKVQGRSTPWGWAVTGVAILVGLMVVKAPVWNAAKVGLRSEEPVTPEQVQEVVSRRCVMCHNAQVQQKNVALHTPELIAQHAQAIYQQVVMLKAMPLNNATQITDDERVLIKRWFETLR